MVVLASYPVSLHLYALTAATLMMGKNIAYLCAVITQLFLWALGSEPLALIGWNCLLYAALPVYFSDAFCRLLQRLLPKNPFIFTLGAGFFGGILTMIIIMCATSLLLAITGIYPLSLSTDKYLKFLPVIVYPEGFINGVIITAVVAFMPNTLSAFDPDRYFINRP
ncbi:energy-coupling factor ABC transporter permease [Suttonella ornithocola]|uniref:Predicted membrane protein n=1 Tax=Suttonella ornithocola TaxID=279832 RepID=A0A380MWG6_9GAMM|nr:energy-coupling factor ABC transporter permease [Suttonella ornithocola]SUO96940.1 Predicted membrane protein [Suttonella ornithocola]